MSKIAIERWLEGCTGCTQIHAQKLRERLIKVLNHNTTTRR
jgi:coenzyme F420-reducing hydrogenase gamma subunit